MVDRTGNIAASVQRRRLNISREQDRGSDVLFVYFALNRLLLRLPYG